MLAGLGQPHAANVQTTNDELCAFKLEGNIVDGDHDRLAGLISHSYIERCNTRMHSVCLKSNGGSYAEGLKIAEFVYNRGLVTVVADGAQCFSACAIIFMAGVMGDEESTRQIGPYRRLSAGGIVGFHAPYLSMPNQKYSKEELESASLAMRIAILGLVQLSSKHTRLGGGDFIKKSLIAKMLEKGPEDAVFVKTIGDAARWNIEIYDADQRFLEPGPLDAVKNMCKNFHYSNMDEDIPTNLALSVQVERYTSRISKRDGRILVKDAHQITLCELYPRVEKGDDPMMPTYFACSFDYFTGRSFGDCREYKTVLTLIGRAEYIPRFFALDPSLQLKRFAN
jgi:hypothetical protein